jgi:glycosyltransferase involved in cell wall biosynthesis
MKILQIIQKPQLRGAEIFACQLSKHLQVLGHEVILVSLFKGEVKLPFSGKQIHLNLNPKLRIFDFSGFKVLSKVIGTEAPDIIQANAGDTLKYAVFSRMIFNWEQPIVFRNASMVSLYIKKSIIKKLNRFLYNKVDGIASVSEQSKLDLNKLFPSTKIKSKVIPIGVEIKDRVPELNEKQLNNYQGVQLVHVGGFSFEKNHKGLLNIFKEFLNEYPDAQLNLVGDGPLRKEVEVQAQKLGIIDSIRFLGYQSDPLPFVYQADVFVLPSIIEGLPGVILEAFYCQTPVVAYNVGGIGEVLFDKLTGLSVERNDETAFALAIKETITDMEKTALRVKKAFELVQKEYRNELIAKNFSEYYEELLNAH